MGSTFVRYLLVALLLSASLTSFSTSEAQSKSPPYPIELIRDNDGQHGACAITNEHRVRCWGIAWKPDVAPPLVEATDVASFTWGSSIYCYIKLDRSVVCSTGNNPLGVWTAKVIRASSDRFCFLDLDNNLSCWEWASTEWRNLMSQPLESVTAFDVASNSLCAVANGKLNCWYFESGQPLRRDSSSPQGFTGIKIVNFLWGRVCVIKSDNSPYCWPEWDAGDARSSLYSAKGVKDLTYDPYGGPCTVSTQGEFKCFQESSEYPPTIRQIDSGVKQVVYYDGGGACLLTLSNKAWCAIRRWDQDKPIRGTRIELDSNLKQVVLTGSDTLISGRVLAWQFNKPMQIQVRSKIGESKKWSNWSVYNLNSNGRFSFPKKVDLNTQFQLQVVESNALPKLFSQATLSVEARPKSETFTYKVKRKYINNFLQGATISYYFKTDPRYQGACLVKAQTQNAFNFAMTFMGPYVNSGFAKVSNGVCTGSFDIRYNGKLTLSLVATSATFTEYFKQESILLKATG